MRLLFDANLSPRLVSALSDSFPQSEHTSRVGLLSASDAVIWEFAREHGYTLVSKDSDFQEMSLLRGYPPKVIWIRRGNCSTAHVEQLLRAAVTQIDSLQHEPETALLILL